MTHRASASYGPGPLPAIQGLDLRWKWVPKSYAYHRRTQPHGFWSLEWSKPLFNSFGSFGRLVYVEEGPAWLVQEVTSRSGYRRIGKANTLGAAAAMLVEHQLVLDAESRLGDGSSRP